MLQTRKSRVILVTSATSYEINLTNDQILAGLEIEEHIVKDVVCIATLPALFNEKSQNKINCTD